MKFSANGKLLISGEYLVLKGALSLAVPLKVGQTLEVTGTGNTGVLEWQSYEYDRLWFSACFNIPNLEIIESSDTAIAQNLKRIIIAAEQLAPGFLSRIRNSKITVKTGFKFSWGFGSSAGLIANMADWARIDAYELHRKLSAGSGYDVICARENGPVFFRKTGNGYEKQPAAFRPPFSDRIFFIYLGNKQDSSLSVESFLSGKNDFENEAGIVTRLSQSMALTHELEDFEKAMSEHEVILSSVLKKKTLKAIRFPDLDGEIKSLGKWGGDFAMMTWRKPVKILPQYLSSKGIETYFSFDELIKTW
ncbi:MAG: GHMP kinase [Bacteroidetes bacterium]|nr:GHMP kinase [Bacteroidota bacterium]